MVSAELIALADALLRNSDALVVFVDDAERVLRANPTAAQAFGLDDRSVVGEDLTSLVAPREVPELRRALRLAARHGLPSACEHELRIRPGERRRSIAWSISRVCEHPGVVACVGVDVTATRNEFDALRSRAVTDELTGLPNRAGLLEHLATTSAAGAAVVFCDLNGFKNVNDSFGHAAGDAALVQVARRLKRTVRGEDFVARIGGDEFVVVVPPEPKSDLETLGRRLLRAMDQPMILSGGVVVNVRMSIGTADLEPGRDAASALSDADRRMYQMKSRQSTRVASVATAVAS